MGLLSIVEDQVVRSGVAPGASAAVGIRRENRWVFETAAAGHLTAHNVSPATTQSLYDLASLTKSVTAVVAAEALRGQGLYLGARLGALLPEAVGTPSEEATVDQLLAHRAGLEAHVALFEPLLRGETIERSQWIQRAAMARRAGCEGSIPSSGFPSLYSDVGFALVGAALEALRERPLDVLTDEGVRQRAGLELGSARHWYESGKTALDFAATETVAWRGGEIRGLVHDENAFAIAGAGSAGHAGLFGTAMAVARFGATLIDALTDDTPLIGRSSLHDLLQSRPDSSLRAGFDGVSLLGSSAGERFPETAFGHLGFTGTSYWCDPISKTVVVLLTNRVCPSRAHISIRAARPIVHTRMFDHAQSLASPG